jgi:hypothetical protein
VKGIVEIQRAPERLDELSPAEIVARGAHIIHYLNGHCDHPNLSYPFLRASYGTLSTSES